LAYTKPPKELMEHWDSILRKEGLSINRGQRISKRARSLREDDAVACSGCAGYHTHDEDCGARSQG
jgi:hypothetical protein